MQRRRLSLIEVLQPRSFRDTPERTRVTRTIVQPEIDAFEQLEAAGKGKAARTSRGATAPAPRSAAA